MITLTRKEGLIDQLYPLVGQKLELPGTNMPTVSTQGCLEVAKWLKAAYPRLGSFDVYNSTRRYIGFEVTRVNIPDCGGSGRWHKRVAKYIRRHCSIEIDEEALGNVIAPFILPNTKMIVDFDDKLDWKPGDFADTGSCFWSSYNKAREWLQAKRAVAARLWEEDGKKGRGRCWVPYTLDGDIFVMNAYGETLNTFAYLVRDVLKLETDPIEFSPLFVDLETPVDMYINTTCYLLTNRRKVLPKYTGDRTVLYYSYQFDKCNRCGRTYRHEEEGWEYYAALGKSLCPYCREQGTTCCLCGNTTVDDCELVPTVRASSSSRHTLLMHKTCEARTKLGTCKYCKCQLEQNTKSHICYTCGLGHNLVMCNYCGEFVAKDGSVKVGSYICCETCRTERKIDYCGVCHRWRENVITCTDGVKACPDHRWYCESKHHRKRAWITGTPIDGKYICAACQEKDKHD